MSETKVFGIRHHGPGSARRLLAELDRLAPDCVLVEGPPDADALIPWLAHPAMVMPAALLIYRPDEPRQATFYPFADFSPEYQALRYALDHDAAAAFMDLSQSVLFAAEGRPKMPPAESFELLARAAGDESYERWWNGAVEQTSDTDGFFVAAAALMAEMRHAAANLNAADPDPAGERLAEMREAAMRCRIRAAIRDGHRRIVAVCGAWHAPALTLDDHPEAADEALLADAPTAPTEATWVPWTYARLSGGSGYGAGIASPGWYDHLWRGGLAGDGPAELSVRWLSRVGALFREQGLDVSAAHVIEAVRLSEALAALRGRAFPSLPELNEAVQSVICGGDPEPMRLISRELIVGRRAGVVPPELPAVPLQRDLAARCAALDLVPDAELGGLALDLREERDLARSRLLHRLGLLDVGWGRPVKAAEGQGTFREAWQLQWLPEHTLRVVNCAVYGNTVSDAAAACVEEKAATATDLPALAALIDRVLLADLPEALLPLLTQIEERSALSYDIPTMMDTLIPLGQVLRYGGLRRRAEHAPLLRRVFDHLLARVCIGLPAACASLTDETAAAMAGRLSAVQTTVRLVRDDDQMGQWAAALRELLERPAIHPMACGRACWLLQEAGALTPDVLTLHLDRALTIRDGRVESIRYAGDWLDGFLRESGLLLVHDRGLWATLDRWLMGLSPTTFQLVLPLLRRTFSAFPDGVRDQLYDRAKTRGARAWSAGVGDGTAGRPGFDAVNAAAALGTVRVLLGLPAVAESGAAR